MSWSKLKLGAKDGNKEFAVAMIESGNYERKHSVSGGQKHNVRIHNHSVYALFVLSRVDGRVVCVSLLTIFQCIDTKR